MEKRKDAKTVFTSTAVNLAALAPRAHPLFRPLIKDYADLLTDLANHRAKDVDEKLKALQERRDQILAQAKAARDYVDYFEASKNEAYSGMFDDYLRLPKVIDKELPARNDPVSKLLDEVEKGERTR